MSAALDELTASLQGSDLEQRLLALNTLGGKLTGAKETLNIALTDPILPLIAKCLGSSHAGLGLATLNTLPALFTYTHTYQPALIRNVLPLVLPPLVDRIGDNRRLPRERATQVLAELWYTAHTVEQKLPGSQMPRPGTPSMTTPSIARTKTPSRTRLPTGATTPLASSAASASALMTSFEREIKTRAFQHKASRVREQIMAWLGHCQKAYPIFPVKRYIGPAVKLLEDSNEAVRDVAKKVLAHLANSSTPGTLNEICAELKRRGVRTSLVEAVLGKNGMAQMITPARTAGPPSGGLVTSQRPPLRDAHPNYTRPSTSLGLHHPRDAPGSGVMGVRHGGFDAGMENPTFRKASDPVTHTSGGGRFVPGHALVAKYERTPDVPAVRILSTKHLDQEIQGMYPGFSGKEGEENWLLREKAIHTLRGMLRANIMEYQDAFLGHLKNLTDGILKALHSLRTTLQLSTTHLIIDMAVNFGSRFDPFAELFLTNLLKLCQLTKKISSQAGSNAACVLVHRVSYHHRMLSILVTALADKNVTLRQYAIGIIKVLLESHLFLSGNDRASEALALLNKALKLALGDASPKVRESSREVYWLYWYIHPKSAEVFLGQLDQSIKKQLLREQTKYAHFRDASHAHAAAAMSNHSTTGGSEVGQSRTANSLTTSPQGALPTRSSALRSTAPKSSTGLKFSSTTGLFASTASTAGGNLSGSSSSSLASSRRADPSRSRPPRSATPTLRPTTSSMSNLSETLSASSTRRHSGGPTGVTFAANQTKPPPPNHSLFRYSSRKSKSPLSSPHSRPASYHAPSSAHSPPSKNGLASVSPGSNHHPTSYPSSRLATGRPVRSPVPVSCAQALSLDHKIVQDTEHQTFKNIQRGDTDAIISVAGGNTTELNSTLETTWSGEDISALAINDNKVAFPTTPTPNTTNVIVGSGENTLSSSESNLTSSPHEMEPKTPRTPVRSESDEAVALSTDHDLPECKAADSVIISTEVDRRTCNGTPVKELGHTYQLSAGTTAVATPKEEGPGTPARNAGASHHQLQAGLLSTPQMIKAGVYSVFTPGPQEPVGLGSSARHTAGMVVLGTQPRLTNTPNSLGEFMTPDPSTRVLVSTPGAPVSPLETVSRKVTNDRHLVTLRTFEQRITTGNVDHTLLRKLLRVIRELTSWGTADSNSAPVQASPQSASDETESTPTEAVPTQLDSLVTVCLGYIGHPDHHPSYNEEILRALKSLCDIHGSIWRLEVAQECFQQLLLCQLSSWSGINAVADNCLTSFVEHLPVPLVQQILVTQLVQILGVEENTEELQPKQLASDVIMTPLGQMSTPSDKPFTTECLANVLQLITIFVHRLTWSELSQFLPLGMPYVVKGINHREAPVRRAAVEVFAASQIQTNQLFASSPTLNPASSDKNVVDIPSPQSITSPFSKYQDLLTHPQRHLVSLYVKSNLL
ncbi:suppressor of tub2 mutation [Dispira simplex]|nr:suppressor of tub2 mutation [Dispira simplex]